MKLPLKSVNSLALKAPLNPPVLTVL
jgi:hypothetical protein